MTLPTTYGQRDTRWKGVTLGTSQTTIGGFGCALVSVCMMCEYVGIKVNPVQLNEWLKVNNGFTNGNLMNWKAIEKFTNNKLIYVGNTTPSAYPQIAEVDLVPNNSVFDQHFTVAISPTECFDPWENRYRPLSDFNGLKSYRTYAYDIAGIVDNKEENMQKELDKMREERDNNWRRSETFREELEKAQDQLELIKAQLELVIRERNYHKTEADELTQLTDKQIKEITTLTGKNNALQEQIDTLQGGVSKLGALKLITEAMKAIVAGRW